MSSQNKHDTVAAVGVLRDGDRLLVIERSQHVIAPGKICFPGGTIEQGETAADALSREFLEEVQLEVSPVDEVWTSVTSWRCKVHWWKVVCDDLTEPKPNTSEVAAIHWKTIQQLLSSSNLLESNRYFLELVLSGEISL